MDTQMKAAQEQSPRLISGMSGLQNMVYDRIRAAGGVPALTATGAVVDITKRGER